jgi:hypothetical protein
MIESTKSVFIFFVLMGSLQIFDNNANTVVITYNAFVIVVFADFINDIAIVGVEIGKFKFENGSSIEKHSVFHGAHYHCKRGVEAPYGNIL